MADLKPDDRVDIPACLVVEAWNTPMGLVARVRLPASVSGFVQEVILPVSVLRQVLTVER